MLRCVMLSLLYKLSKAKWRINTKKSILNPVKELEFLGAQWSGERVKRTEMATEAVMKVIDYVENNTFELESKIHQRIKGFLNYYMGFAGNVHVINNSILKMGPETKKQHIKYLQQLALIDEIRLQNKTKSKYTIFTDATETQLGTLIKNRITNTSIAYVKKADTNSILYNETHAALLPFIADIKQGKKELKGAEIDLHIDNRATILLLL